jgi:hypothetical protein
MRLTVKASIAVIGTVLGLNGIGQGQAAPAGTVNGPVFNPGPTLPAIDGSFQYALSGSGSVQSGYSGSGVSSSANLSGRLEYISPSQAHPLSLLYGAGALLSTYSGSNGIFQDFSISQGYVGHGWALGASDSVSFMPQSPTTGLSGIPGTGDLGLQPAPDPNEPAQTVLTIYGKRLANTVSGSLERQLNGRTSVSGSGNYGILRFIGDQGTGTSVANGLDTSQFGGQVGLNRKLSKLSSGSVSGYYSDYSYSGNPTSFTSSGVNLVYSRQFSRELSMSLSAGPQFVGAFDAYTVEGTTQATRHVPGSVNVAVNASVSYQRRFTSAMVAYSRGVNAGSGVQTGAQADTVTASLQRSYGADWSVGLTTSLSRTSGLSLAGVTQSIFGGIQVSRRLTTSLSMFVSYTGVHQSIPPALTVGPAYSGFTQTGAIGITYAPRAKRLGQL